METLPPNFVEHEGDVLPSYEDAANGNAPRFPRRDMTNTEALRRDHPGVDLGEVAVEGAEEQDGDSEGNVTDLFTDSPDLEESVRRHPSSQTGSSSQPLGRPQGRSVEGTEGLRTQGRILGFTQSRRDPSSPLYGYKHRGR